jgi:hypothetical protein
MSTPEILRLLLLLLRMIAFLLFMYLIFGWVVERMVRQPDSKVRGFARLICSPLTRPIAALMAADAPYPAVLRTTLFAFASLWFALFAISEFAMTR